MIKLILFNIIIALVICSVKSEKYYQFCIRELSDNDKFRAWFQETCETYGILSYLEPYRAMKPAIKSRTLSSHYEQIKDDISNCCVEQVTCLHSFRRWDYLCLVDPLVERGALTNTYTDLEVNDDEKPKY